MVTFLTCLLIGLTIVDVARSSCFCDSLCSNLKPGCRYGEEIRRIVKDEDGCYNHCQDTFSVAVKQAACFKGCLSDGCSASTLQSWGKSIKEFFSFSSHSQGSKQTTESVMIVDNSKNSVVYALYLNGEPVYSKNLSFKSKNNQVVSYTFMSWTVFDRRTDLIMTGLAMICFILGMVLLLTPCFDDNPEDVKSEVTVSKVKSEKQDYEKYAEDEMRRSLLEEYQLL